MTCYGTPAGLTVVSVPHESFYLFITTNSQYSAVLGALSFIAGGFIVLYAIQLINVSQEGN